MIYVLDASAAVEIALKGAGAIDMINRILTAEKVIAPALFAAETGNVFRKYVQGGFLDEEQGLDLYKTTIRMVDEFTSIEALNEEAFFEAVKLSHSLYDMLYLVLARRSGAKLLTCDEKMRQLFEERFA
jgi:predicted nucleic acid-binding protein